MIEGFAADHGSAGTVDMDDEGHRVRIVGEIGQRRLALQILDENPLHGETRHRFSFSDFLATP